MTEHPSWADPRFPYDPKWGWVIKREFMNEWGAKTLELLRGRRGVWDVRKSRTGVTPESLESQGPPSVGVVAEGIIAIISADGTETIDLTFDQAEGLAARLVELARG